MPAKRGFSAAPDPVDAVRELLAQIDQPAMALVVFFASPIYDREALAKAVRDSVPGIEVIGCTTAGEITSEGYRPVLDSRASVSARPITGRASG